MEFLNGPDVPIESLYLEFRPYGRILNIHYPPSLSKDTPRYIYVDFVSLRNAASARMCAHGESIDGTLLSLSYDTYQKDWFLWKWLVTHPRVVIPILFGLIVGLSYVIFDPIRILNIELGLSQRFSLKKYFDLLGSWFAYGINTLGFYKNSKELQVNLEGWEERMQDYNRLKVTLQSNPENVILITGPTGSGKSELVSKAIASRHFKLYIKCNAIVNEPSHKAVGILAEQINYYPSFSNLSSISTLIDALITVATGAKIGQGKDSLPGLTSSFENDLRKLMDCLTLALLKIHQKQQAKTQSDPHASPIEFPVIVIDDFYNLTGPRSLVLYNVFAEVCFFFISFILISILVGSIYDGIANSSCHICK